MTFTATLPADNSLPEETWLPARVRRHGLALEVSADDSGLRPSEALSGTPRERLFDVLRSCPVKDWWVAPDRSERTSLEPSPLFSE